MKRFLFSVLLLFSQIIPLFSANKVSLDNAISNFAVELLKKYPMAAE